MPARIEELRTAQVCADCGATLQPGEQARVYTGAGGVRFYCVGPHKNRAGGQEPGVRPMPARKREGGAPSMPRERRGAEAVEEVWERINANLGAIAYAMLDVPRILVGVQEELSRVRENLEAILAVLITEKGGGDGKGNPSSGV